MGRSLLDEVQITPKLGAEALQAARKSSEREGRRDVLYSDAWPAA
jgi:hypothetical protein